jgi:hypothetical protein
MTGLSPSPSRAPARWIETEGWNLAPPPHEVLGRGHAGRDHLVREHLPDELVHELRELPVELLLLGQACGNELQREFLGALEASGPRLSEGERHAFHLPRGESIGEGVHP